MTNIAKISDRLLAGAFKDILDNIDYLDDLNGFDEFDLYCLETGSLDAVTSYLCEEDFELPSDADACKQSLQEILVKLQDEMVIRFYQQKMQL